MSERSYGTAVAVGTRVLVGARFGIVVGITSTEVLVRFGDREFSASRSMLPVNEVVSWSAFADVTGTAMIMNEEARRELTIYGTHVREKLMARLAVVCLALYGTRSGHVAYCGEGEPIAVLADTEYGSAQHRAQLVRDLLLERRYPWVDELVAGLNARSDPKAPRSHKVPSRRAIQRWIAEMLTGAGIAGLVDDRGGDRSASFDSADRRAAAERFVEQVLAARSPRSHSAISAQWVIRRVTELAESEGTPLLARSQLSELVGRRLRELGRTPAQVKTKRHHAERTEHQSRRDIYVGRGMSLDATVSDNFVRMTADGEPLRCWIQVCIENATGVITSIHATGDYAGIHVGALLHDAFRPFVVLPDPDEVARTRMKGIPKQIVEYGSTDKPGAIPARVRGDNIAQNHGTFMRGIARTFGADINPSRPGVSPDNGIAEATIGALRRFSEDQPGYAGRNTTERARRAHEDPNILMIEEFEARLQHFAFFVHNHGRTTAPLFARRGISRLQHWDAIIEETGPPPILADRNSLFSFLPRANPTRTHKGLRVRNHYYASKALFGLPKHLVSRDGRVEVIYDPRRYESVWINDPKESVVYEIPNVLTDLMDAPLTREITQAAFRSARLRRLDGFHDMALFAHHADRSMNGPHSAAVQRSLADWRWSLRTYMAAVGQGASVVRVDGPMEPGTSSQAHPSESGQRRSTPSNKAGAPEPSPTRTRPAGTEGDTLDDLDRPIRRPASSSGGW